MKMNENWLQKQVPGLQAAWGLAEIQCQDLFWSQPASRS